MGAAQPGAWVIIRVGDRASVFDAEGTRYLTEVATALGRNDPGFRWERALMSGGTCEATAYQELGHRAAAVCVPLGNYHNCANGNRIAEEYVAVADAVAMVRLLECAARRWPQRAQLTGRLPKRIAALRKRAAKVLASGHEVIDYAGG